MRSLFALAAVAALSCASQSQIPAHITIPILAYPLSQDILQNEQIIAGFASLVERSGFGKRADERAAFVILDEDGQFHFDLWPATNGFMSATWRGAIPDRTVAIAHTHPEQLPYPSAHDRDEARVSGAPIFVLTRVTITLVTADGMSHTWIDDHDWVSPLIERRHARSVR
jgi:hypothetical protein